MTITVGDKLPEARFLTMGPDGPTEVSGTELFGKGRAVLFGMPGAYTGTCSSVHIPSILSALEGIRAKGVDTIAIVTTNDPFVLGHWGETTGGTAGGIRFLADPQAAFTEAMGMTFTAAPRGLINRSKRYAAIIEDGVITDLEIEQGTGVCDMTGGTAILQKL